MYLTPEKQIYYSDSDQGMGKIIFLGKTLFGLKNFSIFFIFLKNCEEKWPTVKARKMAKNLKIVPVDCFCVVLLIVSGGTSHKLSVRFEYPAIIYLSG